MVTSPAAQCVAGTSRMTTRTLSLGAAMLATTASVVALISARICSGAAALHEGDLNERHQASVGSLGPAEQFHVTQRPKATGDGRALVREDGVGQSAGQHDPASLDRQAPLGQFVGAQRQRLGRITEYGGSGGVVDDFPVNDQVDGFGDQVDIAGRETR